MRIDRRISLIVLSATLGGLFLLPDSARTATIAGGRVTEDFSTHEYADFTASTGLWNIVDHVAQAAVVANAVDTRPISFGDGSDGVLEVGAGQSYTFDTNAHPNGFNFVSVNIAAGATLNVTGQNALVIRSLTTANIGSLLNVSGGPGADGSDADPAAPAGGTSVTCNANGGNGGASETVNYSAGDGTKGKYMGADDPIAGSEVGTGVVDPAGAAPGNSAGPLGTRPGDPATWDATPANFSCGAGGAGGGAQASGPNPPAIPPLKFATGSAGGAGGGRVRIAAVGNLTVADVRAQGGEAGLGVVGYGACSGFGTGGVGGSIWLQTYYTLTQVTSITGGSGIPANACGSKQPGQNGRYRGDARVGGTLYATTNSAPNKTYVVQSKAYDLNTLNAGFTGSPTVTSTANGGSVSVSFAGSTDGTTFSAFTSDLESLSNKNYRYVKFQAQITTAGVAGASPTLSLVGFDFRELGLSKVETSLGLGCGSLSSGNDPDGGTGPGNTAGLVELALLAAALVVARRRMLTPGC